MEIQSQKVGDVTVVELDGELTAQTTGEVQETVQLFALQAEGSVVCLDSVETDRALRVGSRTGVVLAASASSAGRAVLSTMPTEELIEMGRNAQRQVRLRHDENQEATKLEYLFQQNLRSLAPQRGEAQVGRRDC